MYYNIQNILGTNLPVDFLSFLFCFMYLCICFLCLVICMHRFHSVYILDNTFACCYINDKCMNHIMYPYDICLMTPTGIAMPLKYVCIVHINRNITNYFVLR